MELVARLNIESTTAHLEGAMVQSRFEVALGDVSKVFKHPRAIVEARDLSSRQKIDLLKQWETDLRLLMVASEENMSGEASGNTADQLSAVRNCLQAMGASGEERQQAPNKSGGA